MPRDHYPNYLIAYSLKDIIAQLIASKCNWATNQGVEATNGSIRKENLKGDD